MKSFNRIRYLGGLPYPFLESCDLSLLVDHGQDTLFFTKNSYTLGIPASDVLQVQPDIKKDRSLGQGAVGYVVGKWLANQNGGIIGAAVGARRQDVSMVYIDYQYRGKRGRIVLQSGKKAWDIYAAIHSLII